MPVGSQKRREKNSNGSGTAAVHKQQTDFRAHLILPGMPVGADREVAAGPLTSPEPSDIRETIGRWGFPIILSLSELFRKWPVLSSWNHQQMVKVCRAQRGSRARWIAFAMVLPGALPFLLGCNTYNANLGASPIQSSTITLIAPAAKVAGSLDFPMEVDGSGFVSGANVTWSNTNSATTVKLATNVVSSTKLMATVTKDLVANSGTFSVGVIAPGPSQGNGAGNNISNFLPFVVCPASGCPAPSALPAVNPRVLASSASMASTRYVALVATAANPSQDTGAGVDKIFLRDTCLGASANCVPQTLLISAGFDASEPNGASRSPSVSMDGRFVAFSSEANNLVPGDSNGSADIFLRDTCIGAPSTCSPKTIRLSVGPGGVQANGASNSPAISPEGRFVAFDSLATNLTAENPANFTGAPQLFLRDTCFAAGAGCTPSTTRVASLAVPAQQ
jgi:hypothetical protein